MIGSRQLCLELGLILILTSHCGTVPFASTQDTRLSNPCQRRERGLAEEKVIANFHRHFCCISVKINTSTHGDTKFCNKKCEGRLWKSPIRKPSSPSPPHDSLDQHCNALTLQFSSTIHPSSRAGKNKQARVGYVKIKPRRQTSNTNTSR